MAAKKTFEENMSRLPQRAGKAFREKVAAIWDDARVSGFLTAELTGDKSAMDADDLCHTNGTPLFPTSMMHEFSIFVSACGGARFAVA